MVDEAAQATEPAILIPLGAGAQRCVLVGDPQQLRPTTFSVATATASGGGGGGSMMNTDALQRSLFERLETAGERVHLLDTQYRMHPGQYRGWVRAGVGLLQSSWLPEGSSLSRASNLSPPPLLPPSLPPPAPSPPSTLTPHTLPHPSLLQTFRTFHA